LRNEAVDVIMPIYNSKEYLIDALQSCVNQTYKNFIVYVIDDNSTENIKEVLDIFEQKLNIVYIRNRENFGPSKSRNFGIKSGNSKYISFLDADDYWEPKKLELSIGEFKRNTEIGMVCGNYRRWEDRAFLSQPFYNKKISINFLSLKRVNYIASGSVTIKRSVIEDVGLFNPSYRIAEDYDLWIRVSKKYKISYIHDNLYRYCCINNGKSLTNRSDLKEHGIDTIKKIKKNHYGSSS
jgi:glycosyltransferase involved in cell wall biosynthesis